MKLSSTRLFKVRTALLALVFALPLSAFLLALLVTQWNQRSRIAEVADRGRAVMPFDLDKTTHVFEPAGDGGRQTVMAKDATDSEQIALIRTHLLSETDKFRRGDFSDPAAIHGPQMPGLAELEAGAARIDVQYTETPVGAQIVYTTEEPALVDALHRWFAAQLTDHGDHAMPGMQH
ncbi:MAG TPA: hypothetical protein VLA19_16130 [Herpetosiphonaceae bacterium]|nr:hypothetical protein [Herpetosiphonaceae bacterium]